MTASHRSIPESPEKYIKSRIWDGIAPPLSDELANYCYAKLSESQPNGIAFFLNQCWQWSQKDDNSLVRCWDTDHFQLRAYFTAPWDDVLRDKVKNFLNECANPEFKSNLKSSFPAALIHTLKVKSLLFDGNVTEALALIKQSNLHLKMLFCRIKSYFIRTSYNRFIQLTQNI